MRFLFCSLCEKQENPDSEIHFAHSVIDADHCGASERKILSLDLPDPNKKSPRRRLREMVLKLSQKSATFISLKDEAQTHMTLPLIAKYNGIVRLTESDSSMWAAYLLAGSCEERTVCYQSLICMKVSCEWNDWFMDTCVMIVLLGEISRAIRNEHYHLQVD